MWARGRVRSCGFCKCLFPRARPWTARAPRPPSLRAGRLPWRTGSPRSRAITGQVRGQGPRRPFPGAPRGDCSSRRLRPNLDRSGRLLSRSSPSCPVRSDAGRERCRRRVARLQGPRARGSCDAEVPRRSPTSTNPRHLLSRGRPRTDGGACRADALPGSRPTPFSPPRAPGEGTPARTLAARSIGVGDRRTSLAPMDRSAPRDFCVRVRSAARCAAELPPPKMPSFGPESQEKNIHVANEYPRMNRRKTSRELVHRVLHKLSCARGG